MGALANGAGVAMFPLVTRASKDSCCSSSTSLGVGFRTRKFSAAGLKRVNFKRNERRSVVVSLKADDVVPEVEQPSVSPSATVSMGADSSSQTLLDIEPSDTSSDPQPPFKPAPLLAWVGLSVAYTVIILAAFFPQYQLGPLEVIRQGLYAVATPQVLQSVFYLAVVLHFLEASYALYLARRVDPQNQALWFLQTLYLGMFSLSTLMRKAS